MKRGKMEGARKVGKVDWAQKDRGQGKWRRLQRDRGGLRRREKAGDHGVKNGGDWEGWRERKDYHLEWPVVRHR